jgi:dihydropteroate synthase
MLHLEHFAELIAEHADAVRAEVAGFDIGGTEFDWTAAPSIMGVVNLSAGSWYRESVCLTPEAAIERGFVLYAQGANIIDVGAESTLATAERVKAETQQERLLPVVNELAKAGIPVSIETYQPEVTRACLEAGAAVLNLTGTERGAEIYELVADHDAAVIICFVQGGNVRSVGDYRLEDDPIPMLHEYFGREIEAATKAGVEKILIDPGLGFYYGNLQDSEVRVRHQMKTFLNSFRLRTLGFPICNALPHAFEYFKDEVRSAEAFFAVLASLGKTDLFRTHEVGKVKAVLDTLSVF